MGRVPIMTPSQHETYVLLMTCLAYWNGTWLPYGEVAVSPDDLGFSLGVSIVERLRTLGGTLFRVGDHLRRLHHSLEIVGWNADQLRDEVEAALHGFLDRNRDLIEPGDDWAVATWVTPGTTLDAREPNVCVYGFPLLFDHWATQFETGLDAVIVDVRQVPPNCWPSELKCRSRMHYYLADLEAARGDPGSRAILLDQEGFVGEGSTANVVAYFADRGLVTPPPEKVLPGVTQHVLYELADQLGIANSEADLTPAELASADEVYFTSTSICLLPVVKLDGEPIGTGEPGPTYRKLLAAWSELAGFDIAEQARKFSTRSA